MREGHAAVTELLLEHAVDLEGEARDGDTPLRLLAAKTWRETLDTLVAKAGRNLGASRNFLYKLGSKRYYKYGDTPLHRAALHGHEADRNTKNRNEME